MSKKNMKVFLSVLLLMFFSTSLLATCFIFSSCTPKDSTPNPDFVIAEEEARRSFNGLMACANKDPDSPGFGLVSDQYPATGSTSNRASIQSTAYLLGAMPGAIKSGWITKADAQKWVLGTIKTLRNTESFRGFYYHYLDINTAQRYLSGDDDGSEVSTSDTTFMMSNLIVCGQYFGGEIKLIVDEMYYELDYTFLVFNDGNRDLLRMAFHPEYSFDPVTREYNYTFYSKSRQRTINAGEKAPAGVSNKREFTNAWDTYAQQLIFYILGAGHPDPLKRLDKSLFYSFDRPKGNYGDGEEIIYATNGAAWKYQFSHQFVDFRNTVDEEGVNWFENSRRATIAARQFAIDQSVNYKTFNENSWGFSAGTSSSSGYGSFYGSPPVKSTNLDKICDGTVMPYGAISSIVFTHELSIAALKYFYTIPELQVGEYGLCDSFNYWEIGSDRKPFYSNNFHTINKGMQTIMLQNYYQDGLVWNLFNSYEPVKDGKAAIGLRKI